MSDAGIQGKQSGMALIELLAALSIVAVMSGLMVGFLGQLRAMDRLEDEAAAKAELAAAAGHLQRTVEAARAVPLAMDEESMQASLEGDRNRMRFVAVTRADFHALGLREVQFASRSTSSGHAIVQSIRARRREDIPAAEAAIVVDGLTEIHFEYADASGVFQDSWTDQSMPRAVRIGLGRRLHGRMISVQALARLR
jgi:prepilin-type N-terminal cleavage/methylation domain-containing protein